MDNYTRWMEKEQEWISQMEQETKSSLVKYCALCVVGCVVVFGAIGLLANGQISDMLHNIIFGLIFGIVVSVIVAIYILLTLPAKPYMKKLRKETEENLTPAEREKLASQMLSSDVRCVNYKDSDKTKERVLVTKDFLLSASARAGFMLIKLDQVDRMETDVRDISTTTRTNGAKITITNEVYVIGFHYKSEKSGKSTGADAVCSFPAREIRDQVLQYIQEMASL